MRWSRSPLTSCTGRRQRDRASWHTNREHHPLGGVARHPLRADGYDPLVVLRHRPSDGERMSLAERVKSGPPPRNLQGPLCGVGQLLVDLPKSESQALRAMLDDGGWQHRQIARVLVDEGHPIGRTTVERHRGLKCACAERGIL